MELPLIPGGARSTGMRERLRRIVEESDTPAGRLFDWLVLGVIVSSAFVIVLETLPSMAVYRHLLAVLESAFVATFTIEYLLRIIVARRPFRFVFSFWGLVDLLAILPVYLAVGLDLRTIRLLRLLRVFRLLKLARYSRAMRRFRRAFRSVVPELGVFGTTTLVVIFIAGIGIHHAEHEAQPDAFATVLDGLWWAVATLTTVGYGDVYPVTPIGRLWTVVVLAVGLGIVAVPPALLASALTRAAMEEER